mmetsp:Transcript_24604/g.73859  ORF Transcript_24604/g.73859 Transcript_24604/m.73859 type:complete len:126 (+) Transcript_24604:129-506(+)
MLSRTLRATTRVARRGMASRVVTVGSVDAYEALQKSDTLLVTNFTAAWCGPCKAAAPVFDAMSEAHASVTFAKIDIDDDELMELTAAAGVSAVPTYTFTRGGAAVAEPVMGANMPAIEQIVGEHA